MRAAVRTRALRRGLLWPCLVLLWLYALGCFGRQPSSTSGVPSNKKLSQLSDSDVVALCNAHIEDFAQLSDAGCALRSLVGTDPTECEAIRSECAGDTTGNAIQCSYADASARADCTLSVGEIESCLNQLFAFFDALSCAHAGSSPPMPPECVADVKLGCPTLFNGVEGGGSYTPSGNEDTDAGADTDGGV